MNYPFRKKSSLGRTLSLAVIAVLVMAMLSGCALLPSSSKSTEPSTEAPAVTDPSTVATEPTTIPTTAPRRDNIAVVREQLSLRSSPGTSSRVQAQLDAGDEVEVIRLEEIGNVEWAYCNCESVNLMGWIVTDMLDMSSVTLTSGSTTTPAAENTTAATGTAPTKPTTTPTVDPNTGIGSTTTPANGKYGIVKASDLNIRSSASTNGDRLGSYKYGDRIVILETSNGWGRTDKGWVSMQYVYMEGDTGTSSVYGTVTATQLRVRSGPGTDYEVVKSLNQNDRVQILEQVTVGTTTWGCISGGWVSMDYISVDGGTGTGTTPTTGRTATVTATNVNIRSGAGTNFPVVGGVTYGQTLTIYETTSPGDGYQWGKCDQGWIRMDFVKTN